MSPVLCVQVSILLRSFPYTNIDMVLCHGKNRPVARAEVKRLSMHSVMQNVCFLSVQLMMTTAAPYLRWLCMVLCVLRRPPRTACRCTPSAWTTCPLQARRVAGTLADVTKAGRRGRRTSVRIRR
jgi:hypothetical protein